VPKKSTAKNCPSTKVLSRVCANNKDGKGKAAKKQKQGKRSSSGNVNRKKLSDRSPYFPFYVLIALRLSYLCTEQYCS
jgi:hypothetical protein